MKRVAHKQRAYTSEMPAYFHHRFLYSMISFHDESYFYNKRRNFRLRLGCCEVTVLSRGVICRTESEEIQEEGNVWES